MRRTAILSTFFLLFLCFLASPSAAQVSIRLRVIQAFNSGATIDVALRDVYDQLGSLFSFRSYRLLRDENLALSADRSFEIPVHPGRAIEVTLVGQRKGMIEIRVKIKREGTDILNTQVRLFPGRTVLIGGPKHGEGVVIFALSAST